MQMPIRCITCGAVLADKWDAFQKEVAAGKAPDEVLDELKIGRYCCRRMLLTHIDLVEEIISPKK